MMLGIEMNIYFQTCPHHLYANISWGTKDITSSLPFLGGVETKADETTAEVLLPEQKDVGLLYEQSSYILAKKAPETDKWVDPKTRQEDYYRNFRTRLVVCWIFSNLILVVIICTMDNMGKLGSYMTITMIKVFHLINFPHVGNFDNRSNIYLRFILWSVAGLSVFRFIGSTIYRIMSLL